MVQKREYKREIYPFREYFRNFKKTLPRNVLMKFYQVFMYIMTEELIPVKFFRKIDGHDNLYEIRVEFESNIYRVFCCLDEGNLVILFNGFQKKTQRTPPTEIERAERIKKEYFNMKASLNKG